MFYEQKKHVYKQLTWCRMPQGYIDSPSVYSLALREFLKGWQPQSGSVLLMYVDNILLESQSEEACRVDSRSLLAYLGTEGHKVARHKLQYCQEPAQYIGFTLTKGTLNVSQSRIHAILGLTCPVTKKDMLSFLGMINYFRQWIPDCSHYDHIRGTAVLTIKVGDCICWDQELTDAYQTLKSSLVSSPALGLADYKINFMCMLVTIVRLWLLYWDRFAGGISGRWGIFPE